MPIFQHLPPLSLYIHLPWCVRKCPYCDFNSHELNTALPEQQYVQALIQDLEQQLPGIWGRSISSIFIGGGTPSLFSAPAMHTLFSELRARLSILPSAEITLEANPGAIESDKFRQFYDIGINRLSIGVQTFSDKQLLLLGRIHSAKEAQQAIDRARQAGFDNFNIDLMYGLPEQSTEQVLTDLQQAFSFNPSHISHYQLTIEPNTLFAATPPVLPSDDIVWNMQLESQQLLSENSYQQYEVSAYCRHQHQSKHNTNYWQFGDYLGLGAGAHGKITDAHQQQVTRFTKQRHPASYMEKAMLGQAISSEKLVSSQELAFEFMLNALRLNEGFDKGLFTQHTGLDLSVIEQPLLLAEQKGLLDVDAQRICPTEQGRRFLNDLMALFLI